MLLEVPTLTTEPIVPPVTESDWTEFTQTAGTVGAIVIADGVEFTFTR